MELNKKIFIICLLGVVAVMFSQSITNGLKASLANAETKMEQNQEQGLTSHQSSNQSSNQENLEAIYPNIDAILGNNDNTEVEDEKIPVEGNLGNNSASNIQSNPSNSNSQTSSSTKPNNRPNSSTNTGSNTTNKDDEMEENTASKPSQDNNQTSPSNPDSNDKNEELPNPEENNKPNTDPEENEDNNSSGKEEGATQKPSTSPELTVAQKPGDSITITREGNHFIFTGTMLAKEPNEYFVTGAYITISLPSPKNLTTAQYENMNFTYAYNGSTWTQKSHNILKGLGTDNVYFTVAQEFITGRTYSIIVDWGDGEKITYTYTMNIEVV